MFKQITTIKQILKMEPRVVFAYLYGSALNSESYRDIDIAVYSIPEADPFLLSADLKIALSEKTKINPDEYDIRTINHLLNKGDLFSLLYLKNILVEGELLIDRDFDLRSSFIESFSMKYRECEGLIAEVCS